MKPTVTLLLAMLALALACSDSKKSNKQGSEAAPRSTSPADTPSPTGLEEPTEKQKNFARGIEMLSKTKCEPFPVETVAKAFKNFKNFGGFRVGKEPGIFGVGCNIEFLTGMEGELDPGKPDVRHGSQELFEGPVEAIPLICVHALTATEGMGADASVCEFDSLKGAPKFLIVRYSPERFFAIRNTDYGIMSPPHLQDFPYEEERKVGKLILAHLTSK